MNIVLVDDHRLMRAGLRALIATLPDMRVTGEANDGAAAMELVRCAPTDVVVTDIRMQGVGGLELSAALRRDFPEVKVVILSMHAENAYVQQALRLGVQAYLLKDAAMEELQLALEAVSRGEIYLSPGITGQVTANTAPVPTGAEGLTPRQQDILKLIVEGASMRTVASRCGISVKTAEAHRTQIMRRLDVRDIAGLVKFAIRNNIIKP